MDRNSALKWEYKIATEVGQMKEVVLNSFGAQGWELVSVHVEEVIQTNQPFSRHANKLVYTFKRPIEPAYV